MFNNMHRLTGRWLRAQLQRLFELLGRALQHGSAGAGGSNRPGWRRRIHLRRRAHDEYCRDAAPPPRRESPSSVARHGPRGVFRGGGRGGGRWRRWRTPKTHTVWATHATPDGCPSICSSSQTFLSDFSLGQTFLSDIENGTNSADGFGERVQKYRMHFGETSLTNRDGCAYNVDLPNPKP